MRFRPRRRPDRHQTPIAVTWPTYDMTRFDPEPASDYLGSLTERLEQIRRTEIARHQAAANTARLTEAARADTAEQDRRLRHARNLADLERAHDDAAEARRRRHHEHELAAIDRFNEHATRLSGTGQVDSVPQRAARAEDVPRALTLAEELRGLTRAQLRERAEQAGVPKRGTPDEVRARLIDHAAGQLRAVGE